MKRALLVLLMALCCMDSARASQESTYDRFQEFASERRRSHAIIGPSYLAGGLVTAGTSLALAITAKELIPKLGATLTLALGTAAAAHGMILLREGDEITRRAEELEAVRARLAGAGGLSAAQRARILDDLTAQTGRTAFERERRIGKIRGAFEIGAGVALVATIAASPVGSTASNLGVGLLALVASTVGVSDVLSVGPDSVGVTFRW